MDVQFSQEATIMSAFIEPKFRINVGIPNTFTTKGGKRFTATEPVVSIPQEHEDVAMYLRELEATTGAVTEIKAVAGIK